MTMVSFRVADEEADALARWASELGVERSALLLEALHRHLIRLASEREVVAWERQSLSEAESSLADIADWGPAEDWSDWANAER